MNKGIQVCNLAAMYGGELGDRRSQCPSPHGSDHLGESPLYTFVAT